MRALVALLLTVLAVPASAATISTDHVKAELVLRQATVAPGEVAEVLVAHELAPGWHTYWINPGDSGEPPRLSWSLPSGGEAEPVRFPAPERLPYPPLMNHGYTGTFALLTGVRVPADWPAGTPYTADVTIDWLVCEAICIPESGSTTLTIPTAAQTLPDSTVAFRFVQAEWALPTPLDGEVRYDADGDTIRLALPEAAGSDPAFFPTDRDAIDHAAAQVVATGEDGAQTLVLVRGRGELTGTLDGVLTTDGGAFALTATGPVLPAAAPAPPTATTGEPLALLAPTSLRAPTGSLPAVDAGPSIAQAIVFAFLGGMILNLMPCVFPVLALKAFGLVAHADAPLSRRAAIGAAYTGGVLSAFAVLCVVLLALKATGVAVGWGFQLQSPPFVAAMALVLFAVGLNLSGLFEVGTTLTRLGASDRGDGLTGSFATGALATVVATPCTAPFMAVAIGAALAAPAGAAVAVFGALGLGLATPFALLCIVPGLARILPKPGVWMVRLKQALAFPIYATAAWLVWVLVQLAGPDAVLAVLAAAVLLALAAWLFGLAQGGAGRIASVAAAAALVAALGATATTFNAAIPSVPTANAAASDVFSAERVAALRAEGRGVFVNATAAWCITCKVNEARVLADDDFAALLAAHDVAYLTADWTRRDARITAFLDGFGRAGVPLYVYYPAEGEPVVLPQILTLAAVEDALRRT